MTRRLRELALWAGAALGLLGIAAGVAVTFFGFSFLVFRSGSMSPEIPTGAVALSRTTPAADIRPGDVVSVVAGSGERITHRVVSSTVRDGEASLVLKGDANATEDSEIYRAREVERVVASVPWGGYVVVHAMTPPGLLAIGCLSAMLFLLGSGRDRDDDTDADDTDRVRGGRHAAPRKVRVARTVAGVVVVAAGAGAVAGSGSTWAAYTDKATASTATFAAAKFFSCDQAARGLAGTPYLYWKLDEANVLAGGPADSSGNGRTGAYQLGTTYGAAKACANDTGSAVTFNGTTGYVAAPLTTAAIPGPNTFAVSMWFRSNTTRGGKLIGFGNARTGASGQYDRHVYLTNDGRITFGAYPNAIRVVTSPASYNDNVWHQVVASMSSAGMKLYVDGVLVGSRTDTTNGEAFSGYWRVGYDNLDSWTDQPTSRFFAGTVDEVAVYQGAVPTDADVTAAYRAGL